MRSLSAVVTFAILSAGNVYAAYTDTELFVPIAGSGHQADGRIFTTTLWLTNAGTSPAHVTLQFLRAAQTNPSPRGITFVLEAGATRVFDPIGADVLGLDDITGALRLSSDQPLLATERAVSHLESEPLSRALATTFNAMPARFAIGNGQTAIAQGASLGTTATERYKMYVVETAGQSLSYSIAVESQDGGTIAQKGFYIAPREERGIDLGDEFPHVRADHAIVRVRGVNGNGRIIFAGVQIARESQDSNAYEMSYTNEPRVRMPMAEVVAYVAVACAIIVAALVYRR
jgi:hypothetical protein